MSAELTPIELECNMGKDINGVEHREPWKAYDIDEVNAIIAQKDFEIERLKEFNAFLKQRISNGDVGCSIFLDDLEQKDKEIAELKQKLEDVQASMYVDVVDAGMENRKLKRALWLARAERASDKARIFYFAETCGVKLNIDGYSNKEKGHTRMCSARWWRLTWLKVERKCRAKAEEYK